MYTNGSTCRAARVGAGGGAEVGVRGAVCEALPVEGRGRRGRRERRERRSGVLGEGQGHPEARDEEGVGVEAPVVVVGLHGGVLVEPEGEEADHVPEAEGEALVPPRDEARVEMRGQPQRDLQA
jgi:hypothetical protein